MKQPSNYKKGIMAEKFAKGFLTLKGYKLLDERFKTPLGEIDLIMCKNNLLVFVEVKLRQTIEKAKESIHARNQQRVYSAAELYLQKHPEYTNFEMRFDALVLAPYSMPLHIENAWGF